MMNPIMRMSNVPERLSGGPAKASRRAKGSRRRGIMLGPPGAGEIAVRAGGVRHGSRKREAIQVDMPARDRGKGMGHRPHARRHVPHHFLIFVPERHGFLSSTAPHSVHTRCT